MKNLKIEKIVKKTRRDSKKTQVSKYCRFKFFKGVLLYANGTLVQTILHVNCLLFPFDTKYSFLLFPSEYSDMG